MKNYIDVTKEWLENATPNTHKVKNRYYYEHNGIKYKVYKKEVILDYSKKEREIAVWLENIFGGEVFMLPKINSPKGIKTADYLFKNEYWDLKEINSKGKNILFHAVENQEKQSHNFIFDVSNSTLTDLEIDERINSLYKFPKLKWLDKIIIKRDERLVKIIKRSDPSD